MTYDSKNVIMPPEWYGNANFPNDWHELEWLKELPATTYYALYLKDYAKRNLPSGHPLYVVVFLDEPLDPHWLLEQCKTIKEPIIVLNDGEIYNFPFPDNVFFYQFHSWHYQMDRIMSWFPDRVPREVKYKASAICHRITQSKLLIFSAIIKNLNRSECLLKLSDWLEEKNVHYKMLTGVGQLDELAEYFFNTWYGKLIAEDDFDDSRDNKQNINSNPWQKFYLNSALHFTNESYHYSLMTDDDGKQHIRPGPNLSEKTYKCLLSGTPFISVAQFDVYRCFEELGCKFDYGTIDLSWDQDPGNLSRLCSIIDLINGLTDMPISEIEKMTIESSRHNLDHIWSGDFRKICNNRNNATVEKILAKFS
jgi:hypothetical protein